VTGRRRLAGAVVVCLAGLVPAAVYYPAECHPNYALEWGLLVLAGAGLVGGIVVGGGGALRRTLIVAAILVPLTACVAVVAFAIALSRCFTF
jgi:hypothetical protein